MPFKTRTWVIISLLCLLAAAFFWQLAARKEAEQALINAARLATNAAAAPTPPPVPAAPAALPPTAKTNAGNAATQPFPHRLSNTARSMEELLRLDSAILLGNALLDTALPLNLPIPAHLRAVGDPGSYIVQARGVLTDAFREQLRQTGAEVVAYVPNNAYLVRANDAVAGQLRALAGTQAVLPWEPYYKLEPELLALAVAQQPLPSGALNLLLFPGAAEAAQLAVEQMGVEVVTGQRSPFGVQLSVRAPADRLLALAALPGVQAIERSFARATANDITRARVRVSTNTATATQWLNLSGDGVIVGVNDFGVGSHPDLPRVSGVNPQSLTDLGGHGTHIAGIIASTGANGPAGTNAPGSATNANFRGMAPLAGIFSQVIDPVFAPGLTDSEIQQNSALTNALISNNSWGYIGDRRYSMAAALWDEAARDALPGRMGPQPLTFVFAGGNQSAFDNQFGGQPRVIAPGTAKNVITVGAVENPRFITNRVVNAEGETNQPWLGMTDSSNRIAAFSARGNVGIGLEGEFGRFKPDVVAPGTFIVSTRPSTYIPPTSAPSFDTYDYPDQVLTRRGTNFYSIDVPAEGSQLVIQVVSNRFSPKPFPVFPIFADMANPPTTPQGANFAIFPVTPGTWYFSVQNPTNVDVNIDVRAVLVLTNTAGDYFTELEKLNDPLGTYGYESGTSQAAAVVSGLLALMQEQFGKTMQTNSPALNKALLINGARSLGNGLDFQVSGTANQQGWGLVNITNTLPQLGAVAGTPEGAAVTAPTVFYDQAPTRMLVTGEEQVFNVTVSTNARNFPLRITLVWTDPPGNPAVGVKLVNDLDLIVTDTATNTGAVYVGNNFPPGTAFTVSSGTATNGGGVTPSSTAGFATDTVNNVENVFLSQRVAGSYQVKVVAKRVNVNAVTTQTNGVAQDYALVISTGNPGAGSVTVSGPATASVGGPLVSFPTNGIPLLDQRVGANSPLEASTNGVVNQWHFFVVSNALPTFQTNSGGSGNPTNMAFATFLSPNLSRSRTNTADIDLFVTTDATITNLNPLAIAGARVSRTRGGNESVIIVNATPGALYYAGVKSEDQQAGSFGFFAVSSDKLFSDRDDDGNIVARGYVLPSDIPDGESSSPQGVSIFAFVLESVTIQNVVVSNIVEHGSLGDLLGVLEHDEQVAVLNNNDSDDSDPPDTLVTWVFDDSDSGLLPYSRTTSVPGTLRNFVGEQSAGMWRYTQIDGSFNYTGRVEELVLYIEEKIEATNTLGTFGRILPQRWLYVPVDVPVDATNLFACVAPQNGAVEVYLRRGGFPSTNVFDLRAVVLPPGDCVNLTRRDAPPLSPGRYIVGYYNPNATTLDFYHREGFDRDLSRSGASGYRSTESALILDDAVTNSIIHVLRNQQLADVRVGVRIEHERASDLVLHVISPSGTRLLLAENRGGPDGANYGFGSLQTNVAPGSASGGPSTVTNSIGPIANEGTIEVDYQFYNAPDRMTIYYDGEQLFDSTLISGTNRISIDYGPGFATNLLVVMNEGGNPNQGTAWDYVATVYSGYRFVTFTDDTNFATVPIKYAIAPFTNINVNVTNFFTNSVVLNNGFEESQIGVFNAGDVTSGWLVEAGSVTIFDALSGPGGLFPYEGAAAVSLNSNAVVLMSTNVALIPGTDYQVSFAVATNGFAMLKIVAGSNEVLSVDAQANPTNTEPWTVLSYRFTATDVTNKILFAQNLGTNIPSPYFLPIDAVKIEQLDRRIVSGIFYQPEEPLSPFRGENAFGDWQLEVLDNRAGGVTSNGVLLAWRLNLAFVNTNPPVTTLSNAVAYCGTLGSNDTAYFVVNVPFSALSVSNLVSANAGVDLIFDQTGVPVGTSPPDTFFLRNQTNGLTLLSTNGWNSFTTTNGTFIGGATSPRIQPGRRYYLAVRNRSPDTNDFCLRVDFDRIDPDLTTIIPITNVNGCVSGTTGTALYDYYSFDVAANAIAIDFDLHGLSDNLDLFVTSGLPLPLNTYFLERSTNGGTMSELVSVVDYCGMLPKGRYYVGVYNPLGTAGIGYELCITQRTGSVRNLGAGGTVTNTVAGPGLDYYRVTIASNACQATFNLGSASTNLGLYIAPDALLPFGSTPTNAVRVSTNATTNHLISVSSADVLKPGCWIIAVVNRGTGPALYQLDVRQSADCFAGYVLLSNNVTHCTTMMSTGQVDRYRFVASPRALQVVFETLYATGDVDLYVTRDLAVPFPGPANFLHASTNGGATNEFVCDTRSASNTVAGNWFLAVVNRGSATNRYCVRAVELSSPEVPQLGNGATFCAKVEPPNTNRWNSGVDFYSYAVSNNAIEVVFELTSLSNAVDLYVQFGLPLTNFTTFDVTNSASFPGYFSTNIVGEREYLCVHRDSLPQPLTNGTWYLAVVNRDPNNKDVNYCLRATQLATSGMRSFSSDGSSFCDAVEPPSTNSVLDGVKYHVMNVTSNTIAVSFELTLIHHTVDLQDVDLYVQRAPCLPNYHTLAGPPTNYPYFSTNLVLNEWICVATNSQPVPLTPGDWFVAVVNRNPTNAVNYCLRATPVTTNQITNIVANAGELYRGVTRCRDLEANNLVTSGPGVHYYVIDVPTNAALLSLETIQATGDVDLFLQYGSPCFPLFTYSAAFSNAVYVSASPGRRDEIICVTTNSLPFPLTNGLWYVAVVNRATTNVNYCLRTRLLLDGDVARLSNGVTYCEKVLDERDGTSTHGGIDYYKFHVSSNAVQATFEIWSTNGNADLYVQHGPCLTNFATFRGAVTNYPYLSTNIFTNTSLVFYPYASTNLGTNAEAVCLITNSLQVPLQEGDWYLAVVNHNDDGARLKYCVRAIEILDTQIINLTNRAIYPLSFPPASVTVTNDVANIGVDYYRYTVASNAVQITVEIIAADGNVDLYARPGYCWTDPLQFPYANTNVSTNNKVLCFATNSSPMPLAPGDWYFAVINHEPSLLPVSYSIRVVEFLAPIITRLTNCIEHAGAVGATNIGAGTGLDYYVFEVSTNAVQALFEVYGLNLGDVNLFVHRELPLPDSTKFQLSSTNPDKSAEAILVASNSVPLSLAPGLWFLTVETVVPPPSITLSNTYTIRASEILTTNITRLENATPLTRTIDPIVPSPGKPPVDYYVFHVSTNAIQAAFKVFGADDEVDLFLSRNPLPSSTNSDVGSINSFPDDEVIILTPDTPVALTPGDWYLAVVNRATVAVNYSVCATEYVIGGAGDSGIARLFDRVPVSNTVASATPVPGSGRQYYVFTVSTNALQVNFDVFDASGNVDLYLQRGLPLPDELNFTMSSSKSGTAAEVIRLTTNQPPFLATGDWYLMVINRDLVPVDYTIVATEFSVGEGTNSSAGITRLFNAVCVTNLIDATNALNQPRIDYYVFHVSSNSVRAQFELFNLSNDLSLIVSRALPLPTLTNYDAISMNASNCEELINLFLDTTNGVALTPGDWFIGVVNTNGAPATYTICAREFSDYGRDLEISSLIISSNHICVGWINALPGVAYHVLGKPSLSTPVWLAISPTQRATSTSMQWCTNYPLAYSFFQIKEGYAPKVLNPDIPITITPVGAGFRLNWTGQPGQRFYVEWSAPLTSSSWQAFPAVVTSVDNNFTFLDPGPHSGNFRFYRLLLLP